MLKMCDLHEIALATNPATADAVLYFLLNSPNRSIVTARPWGYVRAGQQGTFPGSSL